MNREISGDKSLSSTKSLSFMVLTEYELCSLDFVCIYLWKYNSMHSKYGFLMGMVHSAQLYHVTTTFSFINLVTNYCVNSTIFGHKAFPFNIENPTDELKSKL